MHANTNLKVNLLTISLLHAGGANSAYVKCLAASDINMDLQTFVTLDENVVLVSPGFVCVCSYVDSMYVSILQNEHST